MHSMSMFEAKGISRPKIDVLGFGICAEYSYRDYVESISRMRMVYLVVPRWTD